ncbi:glycosyl hydrolase 108 family protein [Neorhizobium vignae]|uniref:glycosyl hydrolase 108 family protein n=1 Tax=Neorhizobium vignae TaxID=690585 RepID=UPI0009FBBE17|nr:glycosyl hydrolase 108 family protein [Neorhizobium vignae]
MDHYFARSLWLVLKHEGGCSDHPKGPGGATMKGLTLANFRRDVKANAIKDDLRKTCSRSRIAKKPMENGAAREI